MSKNWRPDGWITLKAKNHPSHCFFPDDCVGQSFEAGADAMYEVAYQKGRRDEREALRARVAGKARLCPFWGRTGLHFRYWLCRLYFFLCKMEKKYLAGLLTRAKLRIKIIV